MAKLIVANWKSNPRTLREAKRLAKASDFKDVVIAPPYPYLARASEFIKRASLGAQNVASTDGGPYTGEVSVSQLKELKVKYIILGHSERRRLGETDKIVNQKVLLTLGKKLNAILCVGENLSTRRKGIAITKKYIAAQLKKDLQGIHASRFMLRNSLIIAYEPIWAIGTGKSDSPKDSVEIIKYIKKSLDARYQILAPVLYGGSVTPKNARSFLREPVIDGALVGGASLNSHSFKSIIKVRDRLSV